MIAEPAWAVGWLMQERGISPAAIAAARDAGMAGMAGKFGYINLSFPHTDARQNIVGAESRGINGRFKNNEGRKSFFLLAPSDGACSENLCVVESAIDALALFWFLQIRDKKAWIASTGGKTSPFQDQQILDFCVDMGIKVLVGSQDNDQSGDEQARTTQKVASEAGIEYRRMTPPQGFKDWGDVAKARHSASKRAA